MTPRPPHPDEIPMLPMKPGATVSRTGGRIFRYCVRYSMGIGIPERAYSSHLTRLAAERAARRFVKPAREAAGDVVGRFGADETVADRADLRAIMERPGWLRATAPPNPDAEPIRGLPPKPRA